MDRKELIELYKTTLEELRHHDTINHQILAALAVVFSLFVAAISFLFAKDFPLRYICCAKVGILVFFLVAELFFGFAVWRRLKQLKVCEEVRKNIEERLTVDKGTEGTSEFDGLLIGAELRKLDEQWKWYREHRLIFYGVVALILWVALGILLFVFIKPCYLTIIC